MSHPDPTAPLAARDPDRLRILGVESSCDETAAAIIDGRRNILSSVVASQVDLHAVYGGVVPELASRHHLTTVVPVLQEALQGAGIGLAEVDGIAVTYGPGLIGSLLVGLQAAKALALVQRLPLVGVNHLEAHLAAIFLRLPGTQGTEPPEFPFVGLLVSGGHTALYLVHGFGEARLLGNTRDDAAGEALDKVAKMLGLGYPGGPIIEQRARRGDPSIQRFPRAMRERGSLDFSFSGLKTAVRTFLARPPIAGRPTPEEADSVAAAVQEAIIDSLASKALLAVEQTGCPRLVLAGGVGANQALRDELAARCAAAGVQLHLPPRALCTDNAAMVASAGLHYLTVGRDGAPCGLDLNALPGLVLGEDRGLELGGLKFGA